MLPVDQRVAFAVFAVVALACGARGLSQIVAQVRRGRSDSDNRADHPLKRSGYALVTTMMQVRVFRKRRVLSVFHSFIFYAFMLYIVVNALDAVDGYIVLRDVMPAWLANGYAALTDAFSVLAIVGVVAFVLRRFVLPQRKDFAFNERTLLHPDVRKGSIQRDSMIVAAFIVFHIGSRIIGNAARLAELGGDRWQPFGSSIAPLFAGAHAQAWREFGYWGALGSVLVFLSYFPYSKHAHLFMAPVKYFFHRETTSGELPAMHIDLESEAPALGVATIQDLSWPRLIDAYACIQCNRCQDVCPASVTGKALSPAALEINKRMVLNHTAEFGKNPLMLEAVLSPEAAWACTTCGACMQVCPTENEQMLDIIDVRRRQVMMEGEFPAPLQAAFRGMERNSNPWGMSQDKRMEWADGLHVPTVDEVTNPDVLYWVGCAASFDSSAQKTARATVQLLAEAGVSFAVLGKREKCTGDTARRAGNELLYQQMAKSAIDTLRDAKPKTVLASCPHCVNTISKEYPQFGGNFVVKHHTEYLSALVDAGRLKPVRGEDSVTFHDPCYLGRHRGTYDAPRELLHVISNDVKEMERSREGSFCCGAGGAQFWKEEEPGEERISENRFAEAKRVLGDGDKNVLAVGCPFCKSMLQSSPGAANSAIAVRDVAELLWDGVRRAKGLSVEGLSVKDSPVVTAPIAAGAVPNNVVPVVVIETAPLVKEATVDAPQAVARKKWQPKTTTAPLNDAAPQPEVSKAEDSPTPARKKWQPKKSSQDESEGQ